MENDRPEQESQAGGQDPSLPPPLPPMDLPPPLPESAAQRGLPEGPPPDSPGFPGPPPLPTEAMPPPLPDQGTATGAGGFAGAAAPPPPDPHTASPVLPPIPNNGQGLGWASLIVGLLSLPIGGCCWIMICPIGPIGLVGGVVGTILGAMGVRKASKLGETNVPALFGLVLSIMAILVALGWIALFGFAIVAESM
jgi:hypothetical protein